VPPPAMRAVRNGLKVVWPAPLFHCLNALALPGNNLLGSTNSARRWRAAECG
jgi:hypothetical protein